ncbi:MAG TPA: S8 family serine peptidase [Gaiellaceae bacterium]|nr:S8 family serine peptidase [Gaiellaceae bacterium]
MRGVAVIWVVVLVCCAPAAAAGSAAPAILPDSLPQADQLRSVLLYPRTIVELDRIRGPALAPALKRAGGELIVPELQLWRMPTAGALAMLPGLLRTGIVRSVTPDAPLGPDFWSLFGPSLTDPLAADEWWMAHIGRDRWTPPGPGVPLTVLDSGLDVSHEEFRRRPNTRALNRQTFSEDESELHGTAVASVAAAPANGVGIVGVYPRVRLRSWDISPHGIPTLGDELQGLGYVIRHRRSVVNMSFGGATYFAVEEHTILAAFGAGSLMVASSGNLRELLSIAEYPAGFPHVLTVGATDENDDVTVFSSASPALDLVAPGLDMPVAAPRSLVPEGYLTLSGTSFSAPLVSGAAAALWTRRPKLDKTQVSEILRTTARDVGDPGRDIDTGLGMLDIPAAARAPAPRLDPQEPNDDIYLVRPDGLFRAGRYPLTTPVRSRSRLTARLDVTEDPRDVYRVYVPAQSRLLLTVKPAANANVDVGLWGPRTTTVTERGAALRRDLLGGSAKPGASAESITIRGLATGRYVYVNVFLGRRVEAAGYSLSLAPARP